MCEGYAYYINVYSSKSSNWHSIWELLSNCTSEQQRLREYPS